ncbi:MAG: YcxB family protein [Bacteroidales bacterium]|nr:YcxB family protein [Bacteroidales bacterium]
MIVTGQITLTEKELFKILITSYLKKRWWLIAWIWIMVVLLLILKQGDSFAYFIIVALILFQTVMVYQYWSFANDNKLFLLERHYEIDSDKIDVIIVNGTSTSIEIRFFRSVERNRKYYLLYTSKVDFIYLPVCSFKNTEDREWFEKEIIKKI